MDVDDGWPFEKSAWLSTLREAGMYKLDNKKRRQMNAWMRLAICVLALGERRIPRVSFGFVARLSNPFFPAHGAVLPMFQVTCFFFLTSQHLSKI